MPGTILHIENNPSFQDTYAELLEIEGYRVLKAPSLSAAYQLLNDHIVHLALVDLRMRDDNDPDDESGLEFVRDPQYEALPKIVLTAYPSHHTTRLAMLKNEKGLQSAVDYLDKRYVANELLPALTKAFAESVRIDWNLSIHWRLRGDSFLQLAALIAEGKTPARGALLAEALEDLLRKLFYTSEQITIGDALLQGQGYVMLEVLAHSEAGSGETYSLVACGQKEALARQIDRHQRFAPDDALVGATLLKEQVQTLYLAAATYELSGSEFGQAVTFQDFYAAHTAGEVDAMLAEFYQSLVVRWHQNGRELIPGEELAAAYQTWRGLTAEQTNEETLKRQIDAIAKQAMTCGLARIEGVQRLRFHFSSDESATYHNPASGLSQLAIKTSTLAGVTHGRLDSHTVLAAPNGQAWLIDASYAGIAPLLVDFVLLEADLLLHLTDGIDLSEWHEMQRRLAAVAELDQQVTHSDLTPAAQDALSAVGVMRCAVAAEVGVSIEPYWLGLCCSYLAEITQFDATRPYYSRSELTPFVRSLLAASMLYEKLSAAQVPSGLPAQAIEGLWLDAANYRVWLEGRQLELTPQEFKILSYLYNHRGQLRTREQIILEGLGEAETDPATQYSRLNSAISRLRKELGDDPDHPKYLQSQRGHGYRLNY
jgi:DNA-binding response OmpR family regulator